MAMTLPIVEAPRRCRVTHGDSDTSRQLCRRWS
jgi:hypothetical protein